MAAKAQTLSNALLNAVLRNIAYVQPAAVFAALYTVAPTATTAGTEVVTSGGTLYARQAVTFGAAAAGVCQNSAPVTFPVAGAPWGTILAAAITDNATAGAGNVLYFGNLAVSKIVGTGDQVSFATSALSVTEQ
jgi:hypothetical protein